VPGVALAPLAAWMQQAGVHEAVNLDGGGSTALFVHGRSVAERPANEPAQRAVANALRIVPRGTTSNTPETAARP
jgi:exopolysaccharide biosynthesis protein